MAVNQQTIAKALNLSVMTVSRALRHHPDLADSTRRMVLEKAEEMGYVKHLKKGQEREEEEQSSTSRRLGIILMENDDVGHLNLFNSQILRKIFLSIQRECQSFGIETLLETPLAGSSDVPMLVKNQSVEGVFLLGRYSSDFVAKLNGVPTIAVSNFVESSGLPHVVANNVNGMREATEHLIALGHRSILFLGDKQVHSQIFQERSLGYLAAMQMHGLHPSIHFFDRRQEALPMREIRQNTAIVCSNDSLAYVVRNHLLSEGMKLPEECSIVSFDNISEFEGGDLITSYEPNWELLGSVAADLMISSPARVLKHEVAVSVPGKLVIQQSTCPLV